MALMVWRRFSAWSKTMLAADSKTSPVTSRPLVIPVCSMISRPTVVFGSWNAGRQCMNLTLLFPVASRRAVLTWYGVRSRTRSAHTSLASPIETQTSVWMKSTPDTASLGSAVTVIRAPVPRAISSARSTMLGVFGTLTVDKVIESGGTALAVAAQPVLGRAGYWLMNVTALFSTAGATNAGLYPAGGLCTEMANIGQFPPQLGRNYGGRAPAGLLLTAAAAAVLAAGFDLSAIASIGSAIALLVFALVSIGHIRVHADTGANAWVLWVAVLSTLAVLVTFVFTTLIHEPASLVTLVVILGLSVALDIAWKHSREAAKIA